MIQRLLLVLAALLLAPLPAIAQASLAEQSARVEDLASVREIKHLQAHWGHLALRGQWHDMAALVTDDAVVAFQHGELQGRAEIEADLRETQGGGMDGLAPGRLNLRLWISPVVTLDEGGQAAIGRWQEIALTGVAGQAADWTGGTWVVRYVRQQGQWKIARMRYYLQFEGPYAEGWHHDAANLERAPLHFTAAEAGRIAPRRDSASPLTQGEVDTRASLLLEHGRVEYVANAFGYYLDRGMVEDAVDLFYADARVVVQGQGMWTGLDGVRRFLARFGAPGLDPGEMNDHLQLMPKVILSADGRVASVSAVELGMTGQHGGEGQWTAALNHFVLMRGENGLWRISSLLRIPIMRASYSDGWANPLDAQDPLPAGAEPDRAGPLRSMSYPQASISQPISDLGIFGPSVVAGATVPLTAGALDMAEGFDAAENLTNAYGAAINLFAWNDMAALFAEDGWRELPFIGAIAGRQRILDAALVRYAGGASGPSPAFQAIHMLTQPVTTVSPDGSRAQVHARLLQMNSAAAGPGSWIAGTYEWQVEKRGDTWQLSGMDLDYTWIGSYVGGWTGADPAMGDAIRPSPELLASYDIDAPVRGDPGFPFPRIADQPFHFANPVSGREPPRHVGWTEIRH